MKPISFRYQKTAIKHEGKKTTKLNITLKKSMKIFKNQIGENLLYQAESLKLNSFYVKKLPRKAKNGF